MFGKMLTLEKTYLWTITKHHENIFNIRIFLSSQGPLKTNKASIYHEKQQGELSKFIILYTKVISASNR